MKNLITKAQAAKQLGVSTKTIERMAARGNIKIYKLSHRCVRIDEDEINEFIQRKEGNYEI